MHGFKFKDMQNYHTKTAFRSWLIPWVHEIEVDHLSVFEIISLSGGDEPELFVVSVIILQTHNWHVFLILPTRTALGRTNREVSTRTHMSYDSTRQVRNI